jgi:hypothetical protein
MPHVVDHLPFSAQVLDQLVVRWTRVRPLTDPPIRLSLDHTRAARDP